MPSRRARSASAAPFDEPAAVRSSSEKSRSGYSVRVTASSPAAGRRRTSTASARMPLTLPVYETCTGSSVSAASIGSARVMNARFRS